MGIVARIESAKSGLYRRRAQIAGFVVGAGAALYLGALASVMFTGTAIDLDAPQPPQIYTSF